MTEHQSHRILVVDDQSAIHEDYRKILGKQAAASSTALGKAAADLFEDDPSTVIDWEGFEIDSAFQGQEGLELVQRSIEQKRPYAMAFVDIRMPPGWDGVETVRHIWEVDPEILIVICSAYSDYSWQEMVRELGRNDRYLILKKPFDNIEVRQCAMALTERWSVSRTDVLTGLLNRRAFGNYLDLEWRRSERHQIPLACAMIDLDYFKRVNDSLGHQAGDALLKNLARLLQSKSRANDSVCRYGGEEFCVLLPHTTEQEAAIWAENSRRAIEASAVTIGDQSVSVTASIGIAERLAEGDSTQQLVDRADQAMFRAKGLGRNRVVSYSTANRPGAVLDEPQQRINPWEGVTLPEVMTAPVVCLKSDATLGQATKFLVEFDVNSAPVVDQDGKLVGILSEDDVIGILPDPDAWRLPIDRMIRGDVVRYEENTPAQAICEFLGCAAVQRVFIMRDDRPIGVVSRRSLLQWQNRRVSPPAASKMSEALHVSGEVNRSRLMQRAQAVARYATQMSQAVSGQADAPVLSVVESVANLQGLIDDMLACSHDSLPPAIISDDPSAQAVGLQSGPLAPLG